MNNSPHAASTQPAPQTRWPGEPKSVWTVSCAARPQPRSEAGMVNRSGSVVFQLGAFEVPLPRPVEGGVVPASAVHDGAQRVVHIVELGLVLAGLFAPLPPDPPRSVTSSRSRVRSDTLTRARSTASWSW